MKSRLPLALALTGLLGAGVFMAAQSADAQQSPAPSKEEYRPSAADRAAFLDARIAALHAGLALTPDQEKLWPPVETVLRDMAKARAARFEQMREHMRDHEHKVDPVTRLKHMSEHQIARGEALKKLADTLAPLYAALSDEQKHRLPILMHAIRPHHHHHRFGMHEGEREHGGWHHHRDGGEERGAK
jgi:zinc resistance-associated protein